MTTRVLITGGGTAGHTNPGIAIAHALVERGVATSDVHFVGGERGNEATLVGEAGFSIDLLAGRGLLRSFSLPAVTQNARSVQALVSSVFKAFKIVRTFRPDVVVCLGGYAAFAASFAAVVLRRPIVISEQNARASAVNRLFGRFAVASALPYPDTDLPNGQLTGNPIRASVVEGVRSFTRATARQELGLPQDRTVVAVWAGSLGATRINDAVAALARSWSDRSDLAIHHVVGHRDWTVDNARPFEQLAADLADSPIVYQAVAYENRMAALQVGADVAICRCGASTTAELAVAGLPAVLVPLPNAPRDHQRANARELAAAGGAIILDNDLVTAEALATVIGSIVDDEAGRTAMAAAAASVGRPDAGLGVADIVLNIASGLVPDPSLEPPSSDT